MRKIIIIPFLLICLITKSQELVEIEQMEYIKNNIDNIKNGKEARTKLIYEADKELNRKLTPVTEKSIIAGSGDKHDYVSMGPYWWPDPSKPDGLPYIKKDGQRNPELEKLDRNKLATLVKSVDLLANAYYFTGKESYAQKAVDNLRIWFLNEETKMNPNLEYGQMIPGRNGNKGRGIGLIDTYGLINVCSAIEKLEGSEAMTTEDKEGLKQWYSDFLNWMLNSKNGKEESKAPNNHGVAYDVQATAYALFSDNKETAISIIENFPEKRMYTQIEPDGSQPLELERTIALHYTIFNIKHFMDMAQLAKRLNIDLYSLHSEDGHSIPKAIEYAKIYLGMPQKDFPFKQIKEWNENQEKLCWMLRRATFFQPNTEYDKLFNKYCKSPVTDFNWLFYAK